MKRSSLAVLATLIGISGCASSGSTSTASPPQPPFECTSIHPEICEIERQFHELRFEQAEQNAAIDAAERKRKSLVTADS